MLLCKRPVAKRLIQSLQHKTIMILLVDYGVKLNNVDMTKYCKGLSVGYGQTAKIAWVWRKNDNLLNFDTDFSN